MAVAAPPRRQIPLGPAPSRHRPQLWLLGGVGVLVAFVAVISVLGGGSAGCSVGVAPSRVAQQTIPPELMALYARAEQDYGVPWSLLAAINSIESGFGHDNGPSSAGALGPMQFMPATWRQYGVDGNADGHRDIADPEDAIPAAARMLKANGAPADMHRAVFAYNHSEAYVSKVLSLAQTFAEGGQVMTAAGCAAAEIGNGSAQAIFDAANALAAMRVPYNYGGGHVTPARPGPGSDGPYDGLDCSSSLAWVLQHAGIDVPTLDSTRFMSWGKPGPGRTVTLYANPTHILLSVVVNGRPRFFGTSEFGHPEAGTGPAWFTRPVSPGYLAGFVQRHPPGL